MTRPTIALTIILSCVLGVMIAEGLTTIAEAQVAADAGPLMAADAGPAAFLDPETRPPATVPDPIEDPSSFLGKVRDLWRSGLFVPAAFLVAFGLGVALRKYVGWFSKGKQALYFAGGMTALTAIAEIIMTSGTTPNLRMYLAAAMTGVLAIIQAEAKDGATS